MASLRTAATPAHADTGSAEAQFFADTNSARAAVGLAPLTRDGALDSMARQWSAHMVTACPSLCHNPNLAADVAAIEPNWRGAAENVGVGGSEAVIQQAFMKSPGHHANIVGPYNRVGVGVALAGSSIYVTIDFLEGPPNAGVSGLRQAVRTNAGPAVAAVAPLSGRARFTPTAPTRLLDTRTSIGGHHHVLAGGTALALTVAGVGAVPRDAVGVTANVTATGAGLRLPHRLPVRRRSTHRVERELHGRPQRAEPRDDSARRRTIVHLRQRHHRRDRRSRRVVALDGARPPPRPLPRPYSGRAPVQTVAVGWRRGQFAAAP